MFAATVVTVAIVAAVVIVAVGDTSKTESPATPTMVAAVAPSSTPEVTRPPATRTPSVPQSTPRPATPAGTPRPTATPLATPTKPLDLAMAPALKAADETVTLQAPPSPFTGHDGKSITLFDTETKTQKTSGRALSASTPSARTGLLTSMPPAKHGWWNYRPHPSLARQGARC